ncbi:MAG: DUF2029 domain-containing protein [Promethearchaeota archaeon]|nr:MAG: DUF2029 domain-containing protein [Candidatus Lokiarchaeota archaeon]
MSPFKQDLRECTQHIKKIRALRISFYVNIIYIILTILSFLLVPIIIPLENTIIANDFRIFYQSAQTVLENPELLYSLPDYNMPFRYLPLFSFLFIPYTFIPFELGFIFHTISLAIFQTLSFYLIYIISVRFYNIEYNSKIKTDFLYIALMAPIQVPMIFMGQISHIFIFLLLIVILLLENFRKRRYRIKYESFIIGLLLGLSISLKPYAILLIPLLSKLIFSNEERKFKINFRILIRILLGLIVSQLVNITYFLLFPETVQQFLDINSTAQILTYPSSSITRIISVLFNSFSFEPILMLILTIIMYGLLYLIFLAVPYQKVNYPCFISMVILIIMINFTDSWFLNFLIFFILIFPGIFQLEDDLDKITSVRILKKLKFSNFLINKIIIYGIVYFSVGVVIGWTILPTDPILPFLLILLYFNLIWQLYRKK